VNKTDKKINIVHVGTSGVPHYKSAAINRCLGIYAIFNADEFKVLALNNRAMHLASEQESTLAVRGKFEHIHYLYTIPSPYKPTSFLKRRWFSFYGRMKELSTLFRLARKKEMDVMFFYPEGDFFELLAYRCISKLFTIPIISHYVEYRTSFNHENFIERINDRLFDKRFMFLSDGVIPISEYLINHVKGRKKNIPMFKIPPLADFNFFDKIEKQEDTPNFLYVVSAQYFDPIKLMLDAFSLVKNNTYELRFVLHGSGIDRVKKEIDNHEKKGLIKVYSKLSYEALVQLYKNSSALLIPLSNSLKDEARFPQKISEYLASRNPIITTNFGEIKYYFKAYENALVAPEDTSDALAKELNYVIEHPEKAQEIGNKGYETGRKYFDKLSHQEELIKFTMDIINNKN